MIGDENESDKSYWRPMTTQDSNSGRRESLGFAEAVGQYIAPLLIARGFACMEQTLYSVKFQSPKVALAVFHDPVSYEIDLVYALQATPSGRYDLRNMLDAMLGSDHKEQAYFQASEHDRVVASIQAIAGYLRKYGEKVLTGDPAAYQRIGKLSRRHNEAYTKQVVQQPIRQAAQEAWQKRDYPKVRALYEAMEGDLTPVEKKRLAYAKAHSSGT
jgi:hypothetical protein